jgi:hypothetical protein
VGSNPDPSASFLNRNDFSGLVAPLELAKYGAVLMTVLLTALAAKLAKSAPESEFFSAQAYRARLGTLDSKCCDFNDLVNSACGLLMVSIDRPKLTPGKLVESATATGRVYAVH